MTNIDRSYASVSPYGMTSEITYLESPVDGGSAGEAVYDTNPHIYEFHETEATGRGVVDTVGTWTEELLREALGDLQVAYLVEGDGDPYYTTTPPTYEAWGVMRAVWIVRFDLIEELVSGVTVTVVSQDIDQANDVASIQITNPDFDPDNIDPNHLSLGGENYTLGEPFEPLGKAGMCYTYFPGAEDDPGPGTYEVVFEMTCEQFIEPVTATMTFIVGA